MVADMQNESDALHILALASQHGDRGRNEDERGNAPQPRNMPDQNNKGKGREGSAARDLRDFALVKLGIATKEQVTRLTDIFFKCHHHLLVCPHRTVVRISLTIAADGALVLDTPNPGSTLRVCSQ